MITKKMKLMGKWIDLEGVILGEMTQTQKKWSQFPLMVKILKILNLKKCMFSNKVKAVCDRNLTA